MLTKAINNMFLVLSFFNFHKTIYWFNDDAKKDNETYRLIYTKKIIKDVEYFLHIFLLSLNCFLALFKVARCDLLTKKSFRNC